MTAAAAEAQASVPSLGEAQRHFELFFGEEGPGATAAAAAVPPRRPTLAVAAFEAQAPSTPMGAQGTAPPSYRHTTPLHTASWSAAAMTTPRPASEEAMAQWLEDIGLSDTPGLLDALARGAGSLKGLRTMSDEAINAAVSPLQLRSLKLRKLNAALIALRSPAELAQRLLSPTTALADEPPSRPKKQAPAALHTGQISARGLEMPNRRSGPMLEMPTGGHGHESAELSDLAAMLSMRDSKRDSKVAELAKVAAMSAAEDERRARLEAAKEAALSRARAAARRAAQDNAAAANPEATTLAVVEAAAIEAARSPITAFTPRTALAVDEMLARDLHAALDAAALGAALSAASSAAPMPPTTAPTSPALPPVSEKEGADGAPLCTPRTGSQPKMAKAPASSRRGAAPQYTARMLTPPYEQPWPSSQGGSGSAASLASLGSPAAGGDDDSMAPSRRALTSAMEAPAGEQAGEELMTPQTKALSSGMRAPDGELTRSQQESSQQDGELTPRVTPRSRTWIDELVTRDEGILMQEKASAAVVAADKAAAVSTKATKVKPKKLKGAKKLKSAQFSLDIGDMQLSTTLDSKWMAKPLRDALVMPAIEGYLSGKHLSGDTSCAASEVVTTFNGEVVDCSASALSFAQSVPVGQVVRMAVLLPDRLTAALAASTSADAGGEPLSDSKTFVVSIVHSNAKENASPRTLARAPADAYSMTMELNASWLAMPLRESLVAPAIRAYTKAKGEAQSPPSIEAIQITLDGNVVDGARPASELMGAILGAGQATPEAPIRVSLVLPDTAPTVQPRASARASLGGTLLDAVSHAVSSGKGRVRTLTA